MMTWQPVGTEQAYEMVIVALDNGNVSIGVHHPPKGWLNASGFVYNVGVVAWMPFPKHPNAMNGTKAIKTTVTQGAMGQ